MNPDDKPWNEEQWEEFMRRSDAHSARFGDLLETLRDHPDRDAIIAREMGWDWGDDDEEDVTAEASDMLENEFAEAVADDWETEPSDTWSELAGAEQAPIKAISAYRLAFDVGLEVHRALRPYMEKLDVDDLEERGERIQSAYINSLIPAAKIAGGHGIGYDDHALCGNIVCLRKALEASEAARAELNWLGEHGPLPADLAAQHTARLEDVSTAIRQRIAELRAARLVGLNGVPPDPSKPA